MGRAFEYRRAAKEKRWANMSRLFPKLGKAITVAARNGGPDPETNPALRMAIQNAKNANIPKDNIQNAIKKATDKDAKGLDEVRYEGYGPHGVAVIVECTTDNINRTVANVRAIFSKNGGNMGNSGSVEFQFSHVSTFRISAEGQDTEELELEMIDFGMEELEQEDNELVLIAPFESFGTMQKGLEDKGIEILRSEIEWMPNTTSELSDEQIADIEKLVDKLEDDEDVQSVFTTLG